MVRSYKAQSHGVESAVLFMITSSAIYRESASETADEERLDCDPELRSEIDDICHCLNG